MRLFMALLPPSEALEELAAALAPHRDVWPSLRWVAPETWHVTLSFFGEVPERVLPDLETRLARVARRYAPMTLAFTGAGAFPSPSRAKVFWVGLDGGGATIGRLADSLAAGGRRAGVGEEERKRFHPHLTLARSRTGDDVRPLTEALGSFAGRAWPAEAVYLMRSHLGPPLRYEPLLSWPLGRSG